MSIDSDDDDVRQKVRKNPGLPFITTLTEFDKMERKLENDQSYYEVVKLKLELFKVEKFQLYQMFDKELMLNFNSDKNVARRMNNRNFLDTAFFKKLLLRKFNFYHFKIFLTD